MVKINVSESKPDGGDWLNDECDCHLIIDNVENFANNQESPRLEFDFRIVGAVDPRNNPLPSVVGKSLKKSRFALTANAAGRLMELACAIGLYTKEQWRKDKEASVEADLPLDTDSVGRQFCAPIRRKPWDDYAERSAKDNLKAAQEAGDEKKVATYTRVLANKQGMLQIGGEKGFTFWAIGDADADHIPLDPDYIATFENGLPTKNGTLRKRGSAATPPAGGGGKSGGGNGSSGNGHKPPAGNAADNREPAGAAAGGDDGGFGQQFM